MDKDVLDMALSQEEMRALKMWFRQAICEVERQEVLLEFAKREDLEVNKPAHNLMAVKRRKKSINRLKHRDFALV
jgi:hypothetical protein